MGYEPNISAGDVLSNEELHVTFKCGNMGGMRYSKATNTLVIISDMTKGFYHDSWKNGVLYYTGMGKHGDQVLKGNANIKLYESDTNGIDVHLFEVLEKTKYTYRGQVKLAARPYQTEQPDDEGRVRKVWMFPICPIEEEDIGNPDPEKIAVLPVKELVIRSHKIAGKEHEPTVAVTTVYYRDPYLKEAVKRIAEGYCQMCQEEAPFLDAYGNPYLEAHHVKRLADGGTDTIDNLVAICPNCHRKIHILNDQTDTLLLEKVAEDNAGKLKRLAGYAKRF